ncbi:hypothetical protein B1987_00070 [Mycobacterium kansasii]|uniref:DUF4407 domain-containing protein n=1 Tax=Mycobacterium attenuatum TaxID=2341086 RepID=A0A498Q2B6_9MYCO|nr:DUF4407 domain-containing protein [Mycobacterium attenuatum]ORB82536.1 hypothetical protein B1987_00070 [Mycobacterium kansasii]VBA39054.1 hypothetical protein LAUMK136_02768 [Mycobacterium attenuatum]VBA53292.1 hypothetical protein LAUMK191_02735 [Mycobacterium attenuatum]
MRAHENPDQRSAVTRLEALLTWLGGGHWGELGERHERSTHAVAGAVVAFGAGLAWLVASLALNESTGWPSWAVVAVALVFALLVGAVVRGTAGGPGRGRAGTAGRAGVALAVGVVVGELAALIAFSAAIDQRLDERALRRADSAPAVAQASAWLQQSRAGRAALDNAVEQARGHLDTALVIARCEYHPTPGCPQTRITGVPGQGPETRTANELLADAQRELDNALTARDRQAPDFDARVRQDQQAVNAARHAVVADAGRGLGTRWVAMNDVTLASAGALVLRALLIAFFALVYLLPLVLRLWRGETTHDRHAAARAEQERAELEAETAIAIKRAEVRRAAEIMWAEHQLAQTRLAIEAQAEIDREQQRRRVIEALEIPVRASSQRHFEPVEPVEPVEEVEEDMYLPIAAEAEAASRAVAQLPSATADHLAQAPDQLPEQVDSEGAVAAEETERGGPLIPSIPDATKAAARWIRPLMPPFVARVIDNTTQPLRTARQVFEEVEEIAFSFKRTRKVTVNSESSEGADRSDGSRDQPTRQSPVAEAPTGRNRIESSRGEANSGAYDQNYERLGANARYRSVEQSPEDLAALSVGSTGQQNRRELVGRDGPAELRSPDGPRELPPGK